MYAWVDEVALANGLPFKDKSGGRLLGRRTWRRSGAKWSARALGWELLSILRNWTGSAMNACLDSLGDEWEVSEVAVVAARAGPSRRSARAPAPARPRFRGFPRRGPELGRGGGGAAIQGAPRDRRIARGAPRRRGRGGRRRRASSRSRWKTRARSRRRSWTTRNASRASTTRCGARWPRAPRRTARRRRRPRASRTRATSSWRRERAQGLGRHKSACQVRPVPALHGSRLRTRALPVCGVQEVPRSTLSLEVPAQGLLLGVRGCGAEPPVQLRDALVVCGR